MRLLWTKIQGIFMFQILTRIAIMITERFRNTIVKENFPKHIVDFTTFDKGNYSRYEPIDITIGSGQNLYVLVKPYRKHSDDSWWPLAGFCVLNYSFEGDFKQEFYFTQFEEEWSPAAIAYYDGYIFVTNGRIIKRISECNGQSSDISLPINEKNVNTWPDIHTTDMAIANGSIWLVGQASFSDNSVGCHITKLDPTCKDRETFYSQGRTNFYGANPNQPGVALDRNGNIFVATCYCKSLEIFNYEGKFLTQIEIGDERSNTTLPFGVAIGRNEDVYILDHASDVVHVYKVRL